MSLRRPDAGDWVKARRQIPVTLTDHLLGTGITPRTEGVVIDRTATRLTVEFATGGRSVITTVSADDCQLTRRHGGYQRFRRRTHLMAIVRLALAGFLLWPVASFLVSFLWRHRTADGLVAALIEAALDSASESLTLAIQYPVRSLLYFAFITVLGRIAFRR